MPALVQTVCPLLPNIWPAPSAAPCSETSPAWRDSKPCPRCGVSALPPPASHTSSKVASRADNSPPAAQPRLSVPVLYFLLLPKLPLCAARCCSSLFSPIDPSRIFRGRISRLGDISNESKRG